MGAALADLRTVRGPYFATFRTAASWRQANICCCGDYLFDHGGPENRGSCRVCRDGVAPPGGADGCQRFRAVGDAQ
jgi:hypothetical protein